MANFATLKAAINAVIKTNGNKEITGEVLNQVLNAMVTSLGANYQFAGVATPSTNPGTPDQNVFYLAIEAGTYTNFNATVLPAGISILLWNGSWSHQTFFEIDSVPTSGSDNLISSGAVFEKMKLDGGAYDVSAHNEGAKFASLSALLSSENLNTLIPVDVRHGGMSIKFVQSSDNNYVQYRLMSDEWSTTVANWQGVDKEPVEGSKNLAESGGILKSIPIRTINDNEADLSFNDVNGNSIVSFQNGEVLTKNFDSSKAKIKKDFTKADFVVSDEEGNAIVSFQNGGIKTKRFDSSDMDLKSINELTSADLVISDSNQNVIAEFSEGHIKTKYFDSRNAKKSINILMVGNSYDAQAFGYAPKLIEEAIIDVDVNVVILYQGSCTIQTHLTKWGTNGTYDAYVYKTTEGAWRNAVTLSLRGALDLMRYDMITIHQQSSDSRDYTTYQPYLSELLDDINDYLQYPVKFGLLLNPSYPASNTSGLDGDTMESMFAKICSAAQDVVEKTIIDCIIPVGTAIANARTLSSFASMGIAGNLCSDGLHLQEGLPILLECYVSTMFFVNLISPKNGIWGSKIRPDASYANAINKPQRDHGTNIGITDSNCLLAQKCAIMAMKNPLIVTDMNNII